jgi:O-antigen/teichoic acid export membrane protein
VNGSLAKSTLQTSGMLGLRLVTQAGILILLTRLLGPRAYGSYTAAASLAMVLGLLPNLGAGFVILARNAADKSGVADVWRWAWPTIALFGTFLLFVFMAAASFISAPPLPILILLPLGIAELLFTPFNVLLSFALQAKERVPLSQCVQWLPLGLRVLALFPCYFLPETQRLHAYVMLQLIASVMGAGIGLWITRRYVELTWQPRLPTRKELREGMSYAAMNLVAANPSELDKIVAVRVIGAHDAGIYTATARVMVSAVTPVTALLLASLPRLFRHAHRPSPEGRRLIKQIALLAFGWGMLSALVLALCSPLLPVLFGPLFSSTAGLMPWVAAVAPLLSLRLTAGAVLTTLAKPLERLAFEFFGILILVAGIFLLAPYYGARGLAIASVLAEAGMAGTGWYMVRRNLIANGMNA